MSSFFSQLKDTAKNAFNKSVKAGISNSGLGNTLNKLGLGLTEQTTNGLLNTPVTVSNFAANLTQSVPRSGASQDLTTLEAEFQRNTAFYNYLISGTGEGIGSKTASSATADGKTYSDLYIENLENEIAELTKSYKAANTSTKKSSKKSSKKNDKKTTTTATILSNGLTADQQQVIASKQAELLAAKNSRNSPANAEGKAKYMPLKSEGSNIVKTENADILGFKVPDWGYADFINERAIFQKSLYSGVGEPGWFYFKIFFNFDTQYGLFGGLLNDDDFRQATNSAAKYLYYSEQLYKQERPNDRITALFKFASILSFINTNSPWFFSSVKNLNQAANPYLNEFSKSRSIEIGCSPDSVDMRLSTLMDLYRFACYDDMNCKEIIPENLRKFDMSIAVFQAPIRYLHTAMKSKTQGKFDYKTMNPQRGYDKVMSFKLYSFVNCEIDKDSLGAMMPGEIKNETPFQMGNQSIKINYDRVYMHTMNEFNEMLFGSDGFYYNKYSDYGTSGILQGTLDGETQANRYAAMQDALNEVVTESTTETSATSYKHLVDATEAICGHNLMKMGGNVFGNISQESNDRQIEHFDSDGNVLTDYVNDAEWKNKTTDFFNYKLKRLHNSQSEDVQTYLNNLGKELLASLFGTGTATFSNTLKEGTDDGYLPGYANTGIHRVNETTYDRSVYFNAKLQQLTKGYIANPGDMVQNRISSFLNGFGDSTVYDAWTTAKNADALLTSWMQDTNNTFILGAKEHMQILHNFDTDGSRRISISGSSNTEYLNNKLQQLHRSTRSIGNWLNDDNNDTVSSKGITRGADNSQIKSNYYIEKLKNLINTNNKNRIASWLDNDGDDTVTSKGITRIAGGTQWRSEYFKEKLQQLKNTDQNKRVALWLDEDSDDTVTSRGITRINGKQYVSEYYKTKLSQLKDNIVDPGNNVQLAGAQTQYDDGYYKTNKWSITRINGRQVISDYFKKKLEQLRDGKVTPAEIIQAIGSHTSWNDDGVLNKFGITRVNGQQVQSDYYKEKLQQLFGGYASPSDMIQVTGAHQQPTTNNETQPKKYSITRVGGRQVISDYFKKKIAKLGYANKLSRK